MYMFYVGIPGGSVSDILVEVGISEGSHYWERVIYDLAFFVWMGILLFNIISGLMLDAFGALREEANEREDILANTCFICGITRATYDDLGLAGAARSFDYHIEEEHNIWSYVNFLADLKDKDVKDFDGRETYVDEQIKEESLTWLPSHTSYNIEAQRRAAEAAAAEDSDSDNDDE